jgi:hypothetical protein
MMVSPQISVEPKLFEKLLNCLGNQIHVAELEPDDRKILQEESIKVYEEASVLLARWRAVFNYSSATRRRECK